MPFAQKGTKKNERHFGVYALLNLKSDVSFVMLLCDSGWSLSCTVERLPRALSM